MKHLAKEITIALRIDTWCGSNAMLAGENSGNQHVVFQEEFATCEKCRAAFADAFVGHSTKREKSAKVYGAA